MKTRDMLVDELLDLAFAEDIGDGDHTTLSTIPADEMGRQRLVVKEEGILAGVEVAAKVFEKLDPSLKMTVMIGDGAHVCPGDIAFTVEGPVRSLLIAERTMLNIMHTGHAYARKRGCKDRRWCKPPYRAFRYDIDKRQSC